MSNEKIGEECTCIICKQLLQEESDAYRCELCDFKWMCHECYYKHAPANKIGCVVSSLSWDTDSTPNDLGSKKLKEEKQ